ncbi:LysM peptidoglycan-binding domain-containing protein [Kitasatospora sp. NPDC049258]|uniref:LysM peptidoglycan-binding domain-containing protein n=1 Tax=Kitasatospora sp. NPDC049258 TaxID=3155394 RepID=UPI00343C8A3F
MTAPSRTAGRRLAAALRAACALAVLLALLAGLPALLWLFTTTLLPHGIGGAELTGLFTQRQNVSTPLLACLTAAGWAGWAGFALCVLLEIPSQLSGRPGVRLPALGAPQRLAAFLIGAILLALPATSALAAPAPAHAATARPLITSSAPITVDHTATAAAVTGTPSETAGTDQHVRYTVKDRDSLWSIAQQHLGDGTRWKDIAHLNAGRTMGDGTEFDADSVQAGWTLLLPDDAHGPDLTLQQPGRNAAPAPPATTTAAETTGTTTLGGGTAAAGPDATWPTHTVRSPTETPWDLAVSALGDGQRWPDIAALNPDIPQISADHPLPQGAVVKLPAPAPAPPPKATATPESSPAPEPATRSTHVTVQEGDSLWSIAGTAYGDPTQWPAIFDANQGEAQPGGRRFTNPDVIYPGQELDVPAAAEARTPAAVDGGPAAPAEDQAPAQPDTVPDQAPVTGGQPQGDRQATAAPQTSTPASPAAATPSPDSSPAFSSPSVPSQSSGPSATSASEQLQAGQEHALAPAEIWLGAGALAAALIGTVALRRRLQQRRLRPGRHIPLPTGRAAATEQSLRASQRPAGFDLLDQALRTLALNLTAAGRELPVVEAVALSETRVELHLGQAAAVGQPAPMKPFTASAGRDQVWTCSASSPDLRSGDDLRGADAPYPALVSIGWDTDNRLVLVDLEHVGVLHLAGDATQTRQVLQALAVELATTPIPSHLEITALGTTSTGLETAAPERVVRITDLAQAVDGLVAHTTDQRRALTAIGADSPRTARLGDTACDSWTPHILLAQDLPAGPDTDRLVSALTHRPRTAAAVITTTSTVASDGWTLNCHGPGEAVILPGSGLPVHLQGLTDEHFSDALDILTLASSTVDAPVPGWILEPEPDEPTTEPETAPGRLDDGLPAEYADLEQDILDDTAAATDGPDTASPAGPPPSLTKDPEAGHAEAGGPSLADLLAEPDEPATTTEAHAILPTPTLPPVATAAVAAPAQPRTAPLAEPCTPPAAADGPTVLLLGPIAVEGATGRIDSNRRRSATELITYLALNPGGDHHAVDAALWPGQIVSKQVRNAVISRARSWLGTDPNGNAYMPRIQDTGDNRYRLARTVTCDWTTFQQHTRTGLADPGEDGDLALRRALALVRGRPFTGIDPGRYSWAEYAIQGMVSEITRAAHELSTRRLDAGDTTGSLWAARQGLLAGEENEVLHRCLFRAHHAAGDIDALRSSAAVLARINHKLGDIDMEAETAALLQELLPRPVSVR